MGTGGSRAGAGRPRWRGICEQSMPFDIRELARRQRLIVGAVFQWRWFQGTKQIGLISVQVRPGVVIANYTLTPISGGTRRVECTIKVDRCAGGFGSRPMFCCPKCGHRCAVVYFGGVTFACRGCLRLGYASEAENLIGRLWRKQAKIERRLAGGADAWDGAKPIRMHQSTFDRLICALDQIEQDKSSAFTRNHLPLLMKIGFRLPGD
jgi:hypothetical protein